MTCERFEERLIAGDRPNDDPALAAHVGSCLRCFRTAADLREVPRLAALMRRSEAEAAASFDPGPRFWEKFPAEVSAAWMRTRLSRVPSAGLPAQARRVKATEGQGQGQGQADGQGDVRRLWVWLGSWMRRPVPAALSGAVCAVGLALLVLGPGLRAPERGHADPTAAAPLGAAELGVEDAALGALGDETMAELDLEGLANLRDDLNRALGPLDEPAAGEIDDLAGSASSDPTRVVEDLEMLDETGLLALQERLRERI